jgi:hypothetical protein
MRGTRAVRVVRDSSVGSGESGHHAGWDTSAIAVAARLSAGVAACSSSKRLRSATGGFVRTAPTTTSCSERTLALQLLLRRHPARHHPARRMAERSRTFDSLSAARALRRSLVLRYSAQPTGLCCVPYRCCMRCIDAAARARLRRLRARSTALPRFRPPSPSTKQCGEHVPSAQRSECAAPVPPTIAHRVLRVPQVLPP